MVQRHVRARYGQICAHLRHGHPQNIHQSLHPRRHGRFGRSVRQPPATRLPARGRPGILLRRRAVARRLLDGAHQPGVQGDREDHHGHPRRGIRHHRRRAQPAQHGADHLQRIFLRHAQAVGRADHAADAIQEHHAPHQRAPRRVARGHGLRLFSTGHSRRRHIRRGELHPAGPQRWLCAIPRREHQDVHGSRGQEART